MVETAVPMRRATVSASASCLMLNSGPNTGCGEGLPAAGAGIVEPSTAVHVPARSGRCRACANEANTSANAASAAGCNLDIIGCSGVQATLYTHASQAA
jgi:hypothetical protein